MLKKLVFIGSSQEDLRAMPEDIKDVFGAALLDVQFGDWPGGARRFGEGLPPSIAKLAEDHDGDTYRVAFTLAFEGHVYVLHAFQKKSVKGRASPLRELGTIRQRFRAAMTHHKDSYGHQD